MLGGLRVPAARASTSVLRQLQRPQRRQVVRRRSAAVRHDQPPQRHGPGRRDSRSRRRSTRCRHARGREPQRRRRHRHLAPAGAARRRQEPDSLDARPVAEAGLLHPPAARPHGDPRARARLRRRPRDGRRGDVPSAKRPARRDRQPPRPDRRAVAAADPAPVRARGRADQQQLRDARGPGRGAAADRPLRPSRPRDDGPRHARRHRERPLRRAPRRPVGSPRVRADHRPAAGSGAAGRDRAADDHLAGLQLLRPQRRRVRRHVVLALLAEAHQPRPPAPSPRRPRALPQLRGAVPPLARLARPRRRHLRRRGHRALPDAGGAAGCLRPDRLPGPHRVRHAAALRPHRAATGISAAA